MAVLYGATVYRTDGNPLNYLQDQIGKNSQAFTSGDTVGLGQAGLIVASVVSSIVGVVAKTATMASDNQTVAKVAPLYVPVDPSTLFLMGTNSDLTSNVVNNGTYYKLTGTTGAIQVDVASGVQTTTSRIVEIVEVDPRKIGGTGSGSGLRECVVRFVKTPFYNLNTG